MTQSKCDDFRTREANGVHNSSVWGQRSENLRSYWCVSPGDQRPESLEFSHSKSGEVCQLQERAPFLCHYCSVWDPSYLDATYLHASLLWKTFTETPRSSPFKCSLRIP
jgi:hypothetical protein